MPFHVTQAPGGTQTVRDILEVHTKGISPVSANQ